MLLGADRFGASVRTVMIQCASFAGEDNCVRGERVDVDPCLIPGHPLCPQQQPGSAPAFQSSFSNGAGGRPGGGVWGWQLLLLALAAAAAAHVAWLIGAA